MLLAVTRPFFVCLLYMHRTFFQHQTLGYAGARMLLVVTRTFFVIIIAVTTKHSIGFLAFLSLLCEYLLLVLFVMSSPKHSKALVALLACARVFAAQVALLMSIHFITFKLRARNVRIKSSNLARIKRHFLFSLF